MFQVKVGYFQFQSGTSLHSSLNDGFSFLFDLPLTTEISHLLRTDIEYVSSESLPMFHKVSAFSFVSCDTFKKVIATAPPVGSNISYPMVNWKHHKAN